MFNAFTKGIELCYCGWSKVATRIGECFIAISKKTSRIICDVTEMYLRIQLTEKNIPFVRFLWRDSNQSFLSDMYEFSRVVFGLSSLFVAQYVTQQQAKQFSEEFIVL